ncbi:Uncharacterised protein [Yersinia enterocolitica]|uniref:Phage protein n=1 Tax=Proteus terrae subsp. cibarius TaxID=626774 RepID=A0ABX6JX96_9GAMM|nr:MULTISPECIES: hypothetical protein [Enterobacterales]MBU5964331.1 hypothetical protein [Proteus mirabilis]QGW05274.1 hypothetical protein F9282_19955 [Proteus terrae subsp. cibarius]QHD96453.1 hypothetical protein GSM99_18820 [Proteus terrae subsp. cibarius]QIF92306.1 hypothetical protein GTH23_19885 [Proteus terrae subsp. cibarius]QJW53123.1 hypothetical protein HND96_19730 [Proteus terrae subsp. cibarius]
MKNLKWISYVLCMIFLLVVGYFIFLEIENSFNNPELLTDYQISKGLNRINNFIDKCGDEYKITIANNNYEISCDAGYIVVKPLILEEFKKNKAAN